MKDSKIIYRKLKYIPFVIFYEILDTNKYFLLSKEEKEEEEFTPEELIEFQKAWEIIYKESTSIDSTDELDKILKIEREVHHFKAKYKFILVACQCLGFEYDQELFDQINSYGYGLKDDQDYHKHLERISRDAEGLLVKAEKLESQLPVFDREESEKNKVSPYAILGSYSAILGISFDFNKITYLQAKEYGTQVTNKIKALQKQNSKN